MDVHGGTLDESFVAFLRILLGSIPEKTRTNRLAYEVVIAPRRYNVVLVPIEEVVRSSNLLKDPVRHTDP